MGTTIGDYHKNPFPKSLLRTRQLRVGVSLLAYGIYNMRRKTAEYEDNFHYSPYYK